MTCFVTNKVDWKPTVSVVKSRTVLAMVSAHPSLWSWEHWGWVAGAAVR